MSRTDWERKHGPPSRVSDGESLYEGDKYSVTFWGDTVKSISRAVGKANVMPFALAQQEARAMLPSDALLSGADEEPRPDTGIIDTFEVYTSEWLSTRYPSDPNEIRSFPWFDGGPGSMTIVYSGERDGWDIAAGYSPYPTIAAPASK